MYLTATHQSPPSHITADGKRWPVATLIANDDAATLATLGIFKHETVEGDAPLGYSDWSQDADGIYWRTPASSPEERQAALDAQAAAAHEAYLDGLECTRLQGKLALIQADLWDHYEALIAAMLPAMTPAQRVFVEEAPVWKFRDPVLQAFAASIEDLDEAGLIALFEMARTL